jgi:hypothetical protein
VVFEQYGNGVVTQAEVTAKLGLAGLSRTSDFTAKFGPDTRIIGVQAFRACTGLTQITLPFGVTTLEEGGSGAYGVFYGCSSLQEITLPSTFTTVGYNMFGTFENCGVLQKVTCLNPNPPAYPTTNPT